MITKKELHNEEMKLINLLEENKLFKEDIISIFTDLMQKLNK